MNQPPSSSNIEPSDNKRRKIHEDESSETTDLNYTNINEFPDNEKENSDRNNEQYEQSSDNKQKDSENNAIFEYDVDEISIKPEYLLPPEPKEDSESSDKEKKPKLSKRAERKEKVKRQIIENKLCQYISRGEECKNGDSCKRSHNIEEFLKSQLPPLEGDCYFFKERGKCPYGLSCRFRNSHTENNRPIVDQEKYEKWVSSGAQDGPLNTFSRDLQVLLRKKKFKFEETERVMSEVKKIASDKSYVIVPKEKKKSIDWKGKLILAPLTTVGNLPFRRICKTFGADITIGEMALGNFILQGKPSELALLQRHPSEDIFGVQIATKFPDGASKTVELLNKHTDVDFIDLNVGCPIDLMYKQGLGCGLLHRTKKLREIVAAMSLTSEVPITVKVRVGKDWDNTIVHSHIAPYIHEWGADALTIHGRTKSQRYRSLARWDYIEQCADVASVPIIGNGDIYSYVDAEKCFESGKVSSLMIARGAIIKPWIFTEIKEKRHWDISSSERLDIIKKYVDFGLEHWGSDQQGVEKTRYFLLNWMSFLYRYVPVGLIERLPVKMYQRAPRFCGRDDLETWMASPKIEDWIKLSTLFLGPPPDNFEFEPKHQAKG